MKYILSLILIFYSSFLGAQTDKQKEKAEELGIEAIKLMDEGNFDKSITLLLKAHKIDPNRYDYPYEIAYALYSSKLYQQAIDWLKPLQTHPNVSFVTFQLLGNSYDEIGQPDSAIYTYQKGLDRFPRSGSLHLEPGIVEYRRKNYDKAIEYWENGVKADPGFSSNYFWLGRTLSDSDLKVWSLIYGELFMLLEPATNRTQEMSEILYNVYNNAIKFTSDTSTTVSLNKRVIINVDDFNKDGQLPFELTYEAMLTLACAPSPERTNKDLSIFTFAEIRESFINNWDNKKFGSNLLFDFHKDLLNNDVFAEYNYWLILKGDIETYNEWFETNDAEFQKFADYFNDNRPKITKENLLLRK